MSPRTVEASAVVPGGTLRTVCYSQRFARHWNAHARASAHSQPWRKCFLMALGMLCKSQLSSCSAHTSTQCGFQHAVPQTDRQTDRQTDSCFCIYSSSWAVIIEHSKKPFGCDLSAQSKGNTDCKQETLLCVSYTSTPFTYLLYYPCCNVSPPTHTCIHSPTPSPLTGT